MFHQKAHEGTRPELPKGKINEQIIVRTIGENNHTYSMRNVADLCMNMNVLWEIKNLKPKRATSI
jgi:hypothetical protein